MKVIGKCVLVEKDLPDSQTSSGLIIAVPKEKHTGKVIQIGDKVQYSKVGDHVQFHKNCGVDMKYHGRECIILNEAKHEIIAIL